jgi:hypothetical protein
MDREKHSLSLSASRVELRVGEGKPGLWLYDDNGDTIWSAPDE